MVGNDSFVIFVIEIEEQFSQTTTVCYISMSEEKC